MAAQQNRERPASLGSISLGASHTRSFSTPGLYEGGSKLRVLVCTSNIGNALPSDLSHWIPRGGGHHDVIAIGMQESTFRVKADKGEEEGVDAEDKDDDDEEELVGQGQGQGEPPSLAEADERHHQSITSMSMSLADVTLSSLDQPAEPGGPSTSVSLEHLIEAHLNEADGTGFLKALIQNHLGEQYVGVGSMRRMQMRLRVYVRKELKRTVSAVSVASENTGIAGVVANKGGLVVSLKVGSTSLAFVSCHLAAHEGDKYLKRRHDNVNEILNGARVGNTLLDLDHQFHHVFFFGDLNYRLDCTMSQELASRSWSEQRERVVELIRCGEWDLLNGLDELQRELLAGKVLCGFKTAPCLFAPTFKTLRRSTSAYNDKRMPSYCDRVLWKSMPALEHGFQVSHYSSCPGFLTSDHKPVVASFDITPTPVLELDSKGGCPRVILSSLAASDLPIMDPTVAGALADPYVQILTEPANLLINKEAPRTGVIHKTLEPSWKDSVILLPAIQRGADVLGAHIILMVMDWDFSSADDCIGFAVLSLDQIRKDSGGSAGSGHHEFELELVKGGLPRGWIRGKARLEWPKEGETFKENLNKWQCKCVVA